MRTYTRLTLAFALLAAASLPTYAQPGTGPISGGGGGGGGVTGLTSCADGTAIADNAILRGDGTTKCQGSTVTVADSTGDLQWEGTTADGFEGNFTFEDPTADWTWHWNAVGQLFAPTGTSSAPSITLGTAAVGFFRDVHVGANYIGFTASTPSFRLGQAEVGFVKNGRLTWGSQVNSFASSSESAAISQAPSGTILIEYGALRIVPLASPPYTCDGTTEGAEYSDTSHAKCWCDGTTWQKLSGAGTCA